MPPRARKVQDKWRMKEWYDIVAPPYFGGTTLGSVPSNDPNKLVGRVVETTLYDLTGDFSQQYLKIRFQVIGVTGTEASTVFKGHEYARDYLRSLVRRGSTRVDTIQNVNTKDGYRLRVSVVAFSVGRLNKKQIASIRRLSREILNKKANELTFDQFVQEAVLGKIASDIYNAAKKITPLRHVGVRKSKLIALPTAKPMEVPAAASA
ncbi:MAG: 30S ribosomal protein S3ae [Candidatus Bathyarchaeia archaeon]